MLRVILLAFVLFEITKSEIIRKKKTIPISEKTCPCWWDLEGQLIDPQTGEPFKCACCKKGGRQCGYPMHEWCTDNKTNRKGCVGTANWRYTLSELGHPCHFDKSRKDCAWCVPTGYQCAPPGFDTPSDSFENGQYCQHYKHNYKDCWGESLDCRIRPGTCSPDASCVETSLKVTSEWMYHQCVCNPGFVGNGITCVDASNLSNATIPQQFIVDVESTLTKDKLFEPTLEPTLENGLADDLFEAMEDITEEIGNCLYCNATYLECGGILQSF